MKVVLFVSPDFLEAAYRESEKFSFCIQGYGSILTATKRLIYTNAEDVLGFVYLVKNLPSKNSSEWKYLKEFISECCLMDTGKKFMIATQGSASALVNECKGLRGLKMVYLQNIEYVSDTVLNRDIFGSILLDNYKPYVFSRPVPESLSGYTFKPLSCDLLVPRYTFDLFDTVHPMQEVESTIENDIIFMKYRNNLVLSGLRKLYILWSMSEDIALCETDVRKEIDKLNGRVRGIYLAVLDIIVHGEGLENEN